MEALSGVASGMAVASLSIQLVESISKIKAFIRDVKGAPQELIRLADLLERLGALLEDVRNIMERQTSLQAQHIPMPSMTIFNCLKSCEMSVNEMENMVDKYRDARAGNNSTLERLNDDVRFGLKTKEVVSLEAKIQKDMEYLQMALSVNDTTILVTMLPLLLQNQSAISPLVDQPPADQLLPSPPHTPDILSEMTPCRSFIRTIVSCQSYPVPFTFNTIKLFRCRTIKYNRHLQRGSSKSIHSIGDVISEADDFFLHWIVLGYGIHRRNRYPHGDILPSLSVYPILKNMYTYGNLFATGSVRDIQESFTSGQIHPFMRSERGETFLHIAAGCGRADVCALLLAYGVIPQPDFDNDSPLDTAITRQTQDIDTFRILLMNGAQPQDWYPPFLYYYMFRRYHENLDVLMWLWVHFESFLGWDELPLVRLNLLMRISRFLVAGTSPQQNQEAFAILKKTMNHQEWDMYIENNDLALCRVAYGDRLLGEPDVLVQSFHLLGELGLDMARFFEKQINILPGRLFGNSPKLSPVRFSFTSNQSQGWRICWERVHDPLQPGFLLVSEYSEMGAGEMISSEWPFVEVVCCNSGVWQFEHGEECKFNATPVKLRLERRIKFKARKERARLEQKKARSRMPGTWDW